MKNKNIHSVIIYSFDHGKTERKMILCESHDIAIEVLHNEFLKLSDNEELFTSERFVIYDESIGNGQGKCTIGKIVPMTINRDSNNIEYVQL